MTRSRRRTPKGCERGAIALEFCLVLPILVALLMCIITAGLGYNNALGVADGVREGARFGATAPNTSSWGATVQQQTIELTALNVTGQTAIVLPSMVCAQLIKTPAVVVQASISCGVASSVPANPAGVAAGTCLVKVWAKIPVEIIFILIPTQTIQVVRQSVALYERGAC